MLSSSINRFPLYSVGVRGFGDVGVCFDQERRKMRRKMFANSIILVEAYSI